MMLSRVLPSLLLALVPAARGTGGEAPAVPAPAASAPLVPTVIDSGELETVSSPKETTFTFSKGVKVTATNMTLTCENLVVIARRTGDAAAMLGKQEKLKSLLATGRVRIVQNDREALADRAEIFPDDDRVVLTGNPVVVRSEKERWEQSGPEAELLRGERRAIFKSRGDQRPTTTLPALKDLGYDKVPEKKKPGPAGPEPATAPPAAVTVPIPPSPK